MKVKLVINEYPAATKAAVKEAVAAGRPRTQVAKDFGISYDTVWRWCGPSRVHKDAMAQRESFRKDAIELHWEGYTYAYIAKVLGIPTSTVWDYVNKQYTD